MPEASVEPVEDFRSRLRSWLADNMPRAERPGMPEWRWPQAG